MAYFPVDDSFHSHPKAWAASLAALGLWTVAGSWSNEHHTDGFVPDRMLPSLSRGQGELAKELVAAGLWKRNKGGYQFHQWEADEDGTARNLTKQEAMTKRSKMVSGAGLGNHRRWHVDRGVVSANCVFCQGEHPRPPNRVPDRGGDSGGDSGANPPSPFFNTGVAVGDQSAGSQSVRAGARVREAERWLTSEYGLTDDEASSVWAEVERRATAEIKKTVPYLRRMTDNGTLADIVAAVLDASERPPIPPEPGTLYAVPDPPEPAAPEPADREPALPWEQSKALAHIGICKKLQCPRCAEIDAEWPDLRKASS